MKIRKERLKEIVREEMLRHLCSLLEAPREPADVVDSEDDNRQKDGQEKKDAEKGKKPVGRPPKADPQKDKSKAATPPPDDGPDKEDPDQLDDQPGGSDADQERGEQAEGGEISKELTGKTIQSVSVNPKSKVLPGAQEITFTFSQVPEPLKILVSKVGKVTYLWKGLHNKL